MVGMCVGKDIDSKVFFEKIKNSFGVNMLICDVEVVVECVVCEFYGFYKSKYEIKVVVFKKLYEVCWEKKICEFEYCIEDFSEENDRFWIGCDNIFIKVSFGEVDVEEWKL